MNPPHQARPKEEATWIGPVIMLMGGISIGFAPILLRFGLGDGGAASLGPQAIAFWRYVFATPLLLTVFFVVNRKLPRRPNMFAILAGILFGTEIGLWHWGLTLTSVANATFIVGLGNLMVGLTAWIALKERPTGMWAIAVTIALIGAALLSLGGISEGGGQGDLRGDALSFAAAVILSGYMVSAKVAMRTITPLEVLFWATITEAVVAFFMVGITNLVPQIPAESLLPQSFAALHAPILLAIVVQTLGQGLIIFGLGKTPAAIAGVMVVVQPVTSAILAWQIFNEPLLALQILGAGLILLGVFIAGRYGARREAN